MEPSLTVSLYGTKGDAENLELKLYVLDLKSFIKENYCTLTCVVQVIYNVLKQTYSSRHVKHKEQ